MWDAYRELEMALLATLMSQPSEDTSSVTQQKLKIISLFKREVVLPLVGVDEVSFAFIISLINTSKYS